MPARKHVPAFPTADRAALALSTGKSKETIIRVLSGAQRPGDGLLYDLARELRVSSEALLDELRKVRVSKAASKRKAR